MIFCEIDCWKLEEMFFNKRELYNKLYRLNESCFENRPAFFQVDDENKIINKSYLNVNFYINDLSKIDIELLNFCKFSQVELLEMMGGVKIETKNVFESIKRNQIMLPNNLMLDMKQLKVEINQCTEEINSLLKDGWKLIAVLPQHQQARPDYILGKETEETT